MNRAQHLMGVTGEEASEIAQMTSKINRFGMNEIFPDPINNAENLTNAQRMHKELDDLQAMIEILNEECGLGYKPNRKRIKAKKAKVEKYYQYSKLLGQVD
jgi:hypothetical protein